MLINLLQKFLTFVAKIMTKLSLEYHNARKNYKTAKSSARCADGKENNQGEPSNHKAAGVEKKAGKGLRPAFDPLVIKQARPENKCKPTNLHLPTDYNTAKLKYNASKSRDLSAGNVKNASNSSRPATSSKPASSNPSTSELSTKVTSTPTAESGLKLLGLLRPIDNKSYEFGLAKGIQVHLVESVKLCGLKRAREKSIIDMVTTLCGHLSDRENEINMWIEFADTVALAAAEKLEDAMQEYQAVCDSRDEAQTAVQEAQTAMVQIRKEVLTLKKELLEAREVVSEIINTFPPAISEFEDQLRRQLEHHSNSIRSERKSEVSDALEKLTVSHDNEQQRFEAVIGSLENSIHEEGERVKSLHSQLDSATSALEKEVSDHMSVEVDLKADVDKARSELREANEKIISLEEALQNERNQKKKELEEKEEQMKAELDDIDHKVKQSFKSLVESKNKEIEKALGRAKAAEASANAAEKLLSDLKASIVPIVSTAEGTSER